MKTKKIKLYAIPKHAVLILVCFIFIFPIYWMVVSSFKGEGEIFNPSLWPTQFTLENYRFAFDSMPIFSMMQNSFIISVSQMALQLATGVFAAYALSRFRFFGRTAVFVLFSLTWLIPIQAIMIPNYVTVVQMGLRENPLAVILPYSASAFAILCLYQTINAFPKVLIEASKMDGDNELQTLFRVVLPNLKAQIASLGILLFINSWNDYLWPAIVLRRMENAPIQIGLRSFVSADVNLWGSLMAATTISCIPILLIYLVLQRQIVDSFVKWGIK